MKNYENHPLAGARDLDSAMNKLWVFYKKYFVGLYIISLIAALFSNLISASLDLSGITATSDPAALLEAFKGMAIPYAQLLAVTLVMGVIIHAYVLDKPLGQDFSFGEMLKNGAVAFFPYLLVIIILGTGAFIISIIGTMLLILPGLFAMIYSATILAFSLPVTLAESRNPGTIIERSFRLAHRNLWSNIGWVVVIFLIVMVISIIISGLIMLPFTGTFIKAFINPEDASSLLEMAKNPIFIGLSSVTGAFITPVMPILAFILYFRNRDEVAQSETVPEEENRVRVEDLYPKMPE